MWIQLFLHLHGSCLDHFWRNAKIWGDEKERLHTCIKIPHSYPSKPSWNPLMQSNYNEWRLPFIFSDRILYEIEWKWKLRREYGANGGDVIRSSIRKDVLFSSTAHRSSQNNCMKRFQQTQRPSLPPWCNGLYATALSVYPPSQRIWKGKGKRKWVMCVFLLWNNGSILTFAGVLVGLQLHEVRTGAGEGLVKVDETQVGAKGFTVSSGTWVGGWKEGKEKH